MDRIHKRVHVFLHSRNNTLLEEVETGALVEFGELKRGVERGDWITTPPTWAELPAQKNNARRNSESVSGSDRCGLGGDGLGHQRKRDAERNPEMEPCMRVMERFREFIIHSNRDSITFPKGLDSRYMHKAPLKRGLIPQLLSISCTPS